MGLTEGAIRQRVQRLTDAGVMQIVAVTDPMSLGVRRVAMIGARVEGRRRGHRRRRSATMPEVEYLVATTGRYDLMFEVVADDDTHLHATAVAPAQPRRHRSRPRRSCA